MKSAEEILKELYAKIEEYQRADSAIDHMVIEAMHEYAAQDRWVKVSERPLYVIDDKGNWECTEDGNGEFIAAVPYTVTREQSKTKWWIRHCIVEDRIGLCVVTDDDTEKAGWELSDVIYYQPLPTPPKD